MTILVINLGVPVMKGNTWQNFTASLHESSTDFLCYVISFIVLGIMWFRAPYDV